MRLFAAALFVTTLAGCNLADDPTIQDCYTYQEAVADASGVVGEWALALVVTTGFGVGPQCHAPDEFDLSIELYFGPEGEFVRWSDNEIETEGSYEIDGGSVLAGGRQYKLRRDGWLVHDMSPIDGPVYVFGRLQHEAPAD